MPLLVDTAEDPRFTTRLGFGLHHHPSQTILEIVDERILQMQVENIGRDFYLFGSLLPAAGGQQR